MNIAGYRRLVALVFLGIASSSMSIAEESPDSRTVIGPRNPHLADGAQALLEGDAEEAFG